MDDTKKMLRTIINGQSVMKSELLGEIRKVDKKVDGVDKKMESLKQDLKSVEKRLTIRIDKIGLSEARLEDDSPTVDEFDKLEHRVTKVEQKVASI